MEELLDHGERRTTSGIVGPTIGDKFAEFWVSTDKASWQQRSPFLRIQPEGGEEGVRRREFMELVMAAR